MFGAMLGGAALALAAVVYNQSLEIEKRLKSLEAQLETARRQQPSQP
jgi:hypothetical protein